MPDPWHSPNSRIYNLAPARSPGELERSSQGRKHLTLVQIFSKDPHWLLEGPHAKARTQAVYLGVFSRNKDEAVLRCKSQGFLPKTFRILKILEQLPSLGWNTWEAKEGGFLWVQRQSGPRSKFQASKGYTVRPCLKIIKIMLLLMVPVMMKLNQILTSISYSQLNSNAPVDSGIHISHSTDGGHCQPCRKFYWMSLC